MVVYLKYLINNLYDVFMGMLIPGLTKLELDTLAFVDNSRQRSIDIWPFKRRTILMNIIEPNFDRPYRRIY